MRAGRAPFLKPCSPVRRNSRDFASQGFPHIRCRKVPAAGDIWEIPGPPGSSGTARMPHPGRSLLAERARIWRRVRDPSPAEACLRVPGRPVLPPKQTGPAARGGRPGRLTAVPGDSRLLIPACNQTASTASFQLPGLRRTPALNRMPSNGRKYNALYFCEN